MPRRFRPARRSAFTLIEVMMAVLIMAIVAGAVIPHFEGSTVDAKDASLKQTLAVFRRTIEYFKVQHRGKPPGFNNVPMQFHLMAYSNASGQISLVKTNNFKYGPYFTPNNQPLNPFNGGVNIIGSSDPANETPDDELSVNGYPVGFFYDKDTGRVSANAEGMTKDGIPRIRL